MKLPIQEIAGDKYEVLGMLQEGDTSAVYKARHLLLDEVRVIKLHKPQPAFNEALKERFHEEARNATQLHHPQIARLYDFSIAPEQGVAFVVKEFIDGVSLADAVGRHGPLGVTFTIELAKQCLKVLGYLHQHGFVHRDIATDNFVLARSRDGQPLVKLIDLSITRVAREDEDPNADGVFLGKSHYSSPEQIEAGQGGVPVDQRSNLYSFGVMLYELLTGHHPIPGETFAELAAGHLDTPPLAFDTTDPDGEVHEALRRVVLKTLEKNPDDRFADAAALWAALEPFANTDSVLNFNEYLEIVLPVARHGSLPQSSSTQAPLGSLSRDRTSIEADGSSDRRPAPIQPAIERPQAPTEERAEIDDSSVDDSLLALTDSCDQALASVRQLIDELRFDEALETLEEARKEFDGSDGFSARYSGLLEDIESREAAVGELDEQLDVAIKLQQRGELEAAISIFSQALEKDPAHPRANRLLESAKQALAADRERQKQELAERLQAIRKKVDLGDLADAELESNDLLSRFPGHPEALGLQKMVQQLRAKALPKETRAPNDASAPAEKLSGEETPPDASAPAGAKQATPPAVDGPSAVTRFKLWLLSQPAAVRAAVVVVPLVGLALLFGSLSLLSRTEPDPEPIVVEEPIVEPAPVVLSPPPGTGAALDASPWATIDEIAAADGSILSFDEPLHTPLFVPLHPGRYEITLSHPASVEPISIEIQVIKGAVVEQVVSIAEVEPLKSAQYFRDLGLEP